MHVMALALLLSSCSTEVARVGVGGPVEEGEVAATGSEVEFVDTPCFKLGYAWKPEYEGKPPECLDGLTVVPLSAYFNARSCLKLKIAVARGKKLQDKRETIRRREQDREVRRQIKQAF